MNEMAALPSDIVFEALSGYAPVRDAPDELIDQSGQVRPVWRDFANFFTALSPDEIAARFSIGDQYLADSGVFFRHADGDISRERAWPLSHVPVLIAEAEWNDIVVGLSQRADLLEQVVQDVYGPNRMFEQGWLPPMLLAQNPEWMRPMIGVKPRSGYFLHLLSFELGRSPSGQWWVLNDRTHTPSGAGFALENRVATSRIYPDFYARANVHRLAGFFREFRDHLHSLRGADSTLPAILTPGPLADTYYEHAYIARYLGLLLVEGEDLVVERGRPFVRTVNGLRPVDVLWRRLDSRFADPLELDDASRIGAPGLVGAMRQMGVTMINAIGSGVLETRALMAFLPRISQMLTGRPLMLPNIATWWCGQDAQREHVRKNIDAMMISPAMSTRLPFDPEDTTALGGKLRSAAYNTMQELLDSDAGGLVGQEAVTLSTSPAYVDGRLVPRPMTLRVFLARGPQGWFALPGGYARIGRSNDVTALGMHEGGSCADVWVISDKPTASETLIPEIASLVASDHPGDLTSRAAENLYWLGRYTERAEFLARLTRAYDIRLAENPGQETELLLHLEDYLGVLGLDASGRTPAAVTSAIEAAARCAGRVRDWLSPDGMVSISSLMTFIGSEDVGTASLASRMGELLRRTVGFSGLIQENMYRSVGWRFLAAGRALERAMSTATMLANLTVPEAPLGSLEAALECADSKLTHHRKFAFSMSSVTVLSLLCLDVDNPRSVIHQLEELRRHIEALPAAIQNGVMSPPLAKLVRIHADLVSTLPAELNEALLLSAYSELAEISDLLTAAYLS